MKLKLLIIILLLLLIKHLLLLLLLLSIVPDDFQSLIFGLNQLFASHKIGNEKYERGKYQAIKIEHRLIHST